MKSTFLSPRGLVGIVTAIAFIVTPGFAAAETAAVMTKQVLPVGGNSCAPVFVNEVKTYIYDGELHSFDVVVSDPSYVGISGNAGNVAIPYNYMTRRIDPNGNLRIHVDTTAVVGASLPVTVTLLSSVSGKPTCITTVSFATSGTGAVTPAAPITVAVGETGIQNPSAAQGSDSSVKPTNGGVVKGAISKTKTEGHGGKSSIGHGTTSTSFAATVGKMCSENGAYQLWFILLAIFFVIVAFVGLSQPPLAQSSSRLPAILIGAPLALLLGFWLFVLDCRLNWFIPVILLAAAAIGLYSAYRTMPPTSHTAVMVLPPKDPQKDTTSTK
jgi:hypothetical protein